MKILGIESSGLVASVAVYENGIIQGTFTTNFKKTHSQTLLPMLDVLKDTLNLDLDTVDAIAVAAGPGSFTGLRIGSATAKGLALALDKPIIPIPTVDVIAYNLYGVEKIICPMMDAKRKQVYTGLYTFVPNTPEGKSLERTFDMQIIHGQYAAALEDIIGEINNLGKAVILLQIQTSFCLH